MRRTASRTRRASASAEYGASLRLINWSLRGDDFVSFDTYAADALARLVREGALSYDAHAKLLATSAHAFRHTFGTRAVARDMPIDVVQRILGHASLQTTSIYVRAERQRMLDEAAKYYSDDAG